MLRKIISGGQTGADQGGLEGAYSLGITTGGTAPLLYRTETGPNPDLLKDRYGLSESIYWSYPPRTEANVEDCDLTVIVGNPNSPGCKLTIDLCKKHDKPFEINPTPERLAEVCEGIEILNVAGNRESTNPGIYERTKLLIIEAFGD